MWRQACNRLLPSFDVALVDLRATYLSNHARDSAGKFAEGNIVAGQRDRLRIQNQLRKPFAQDAGIPINALELGRERLNIQQGFIDIEYQQGKLGHDRRSPLNWF